MCFSGAIDELGDMPYYAEFSGAIDELGDMPYYAEHCAAMLAVTYSANYSCLVVRLVISVVH